MSYTFADLQTEVKARSILNESSTEFDTMVKNAINTTLFRISREAKWRQLRRKTTFETVKEYTTGTGAVTVTNGSANVSVVGATFITDGVHIGRRIDLGGSSASYAVKTITGETTLTVDKVYDGTTSSTQSYKIYGQEEYTLNLQAGRIGMLWHEDYGYPYVMHYLTDLDFYDTNRSLEDGATPTTYRQWGFGSTINQPRQASVITIASSAAADTSKNITVWGEVSGYPDFETITTNGSDGTTSVSSTKSFTSIERVTKDSATAGRITVTADSGNTTIAVLTVGDTMGMSEYFKVQIFPYPTRNFPIHVAYYKDPARLVSDSDFHELGHEFDESIVLLASAKISLGQDKSAADKFFLLYKDEIKSIRTKNNDTILSWFPKLRRVSHGRRAGGAASPHRFLGYSQLGGFYGPVLN